MKVKNVVLHEGTASNILEVPPDVSAQEVIELFDLPKPKALVILNGGTAKIDDRLQHQLYTLLSEGLAKYICDNEVPIVTGATDAGIFYLLGCGLAKWGRTAPCIGITVSKLVTWDGKSRFPWRRAHKDKVPLEPHHSHFILVKGDDWGGETEVMYQFIKNYGQDIPSVAVFVGGGSITKKEMRENVKQGRKMILFQGSGRTTDTVITTVGNKDNATDAMVREIALQGDIIPFSIEESPEKLIEILEDQLSL